MHQSPELSPTLPHRIAEPVYAWAKKTPDAIAIIDRNTTYTYQDLAKILNDLKRYLTDLQIRAGDRLLIVTENCFETVALILAAGDLDIWPIPVNARLSASEIKTIQEHSQPRITFYTSAISDGAHTHAINGNAVPCEFTPLQDLMASPINTDVAPEPVYASNAEQVGAVIYTSGTTGSPKGVMLSHKTLSWVAITSGKIRGISSSDKVYGCLPISHSFGLTSTSLGTLYAGGCLMTISAFHPKKVLDSLEHENITVFQGVPPMYSRILEHLNVNKRKFKAPKLRYLSSGGAPLDLSLKQSVEKTFGLQLNNGYGLTETGPTLSQTRIETPRNNTSIGALLPEMEIRFLDADGAPQDPSTGGELWVCGPNVMLGYYKAPELTDKVLKEGWFNTGDIARVDEVGDLHIIGRSKEMIIRSGFNVYPEEVEAAINRHPAVTLCGVVGAQMQGNEEVVGFIQLEPGATTTADELSDFLKDKLAPYKIPGRIYLLDELPSSSTGKIRKDQLRKLAKNA